MRRQAQIEDDGETALKEEAAAGMSLLGRLEAALQEEVNCPQAVRPRRAPFHSVDTVRRLAGHCQLRTVGRITKFAADTAPSHSTPDGRLPCVAVSPARQQQHAECDDALQKP